MQAPSGLPQVALALALALTGCSVKFSSKVERPGGEGRGGTSTTSTVSIGAPPAKKAVRIVRTGDKLAYENGEIEFETGSAALKGDTTQDVLDRLAEALQQYPTLRVRVEGHTDSRGNEKYNQKLSEDRAAAIKTALVQRGVAEERLTSAGYGESRPERVEPPDCLNRSEERVDDEDLARCKEIWTANRRAAFLVVEGADTLPVEGTAVRAETDAPPEPATPPAAVADARRRRPDWALRLFGGYSLLIPDRALHGGHFGVGVHASQRFGAPRRGYIGGGPRLHYRGVMRDETDGTGRYRVAIHEFGPEGDLLVGGGSERVVAAFSLRLGLGLTAVRGSERDGVTTTRLDATGLGGWALGGITVLGKLNPRWSLGGHAEAGISGLSLLAEFGLNVAWHFGRGRRDGL